MRILAGAVYSRPGPATGSTLRPMPRFRPRTARGDFVVRKLGTIAGLPVAAYTVGGLLAGGDF